MQHCRYCEETFDDESRLLAHYRKHHEGELRAVDRRRVEASAPSRSLPTGALLVGGAVLLIAALYVFVFTSPAFEQRNAPAGLGTVHEHGTATVTIDGAQLDFADPRYGDLDTCFHYHTGEGNVWHIHCQGVTLGYAMGTLGIGISDAGVTVDGVEYRYDDPNAVVRVTVNGRAASAGTLIADGDEIDMVVARR
ncbi:hypothetical protein [Natronomonas sp. EA1]|uniref:hypothetical protein n=1 Tax=Natronomonas sp. EA1 TaxID=3421655 RepID=UPI003EBEFD13